MFPPDAGTNVVTETTSVETEVDLEIAKSDFPDPVASGTALTYTTGAVAVECDYCGDMGGMDCGM